MHVRFSLFQKVMARQYGSTREFLHDTEWILHNCIIYNGGIFYRAAFLIRAHLPMLLSFATSKVLSN